MRILILEDDPNRVDSFQKCYKDHEIVTSDQTKEIINLLQTEKWDALFLDHDLGGQVYVPSGDDTGYEVAKWLELNPQYKPKYIILHTLNPAGRNNMRACLRGSIDFPFAWSQNIFKLLGD